MRFRAGPVPPNIALRRTVAYHWKVRVGAFFAHIQAESDLLSRAMHTGFMQAALALAEQARERGEVPVGAVVVFDGEVIGEGFNQPISAQDPTAHAEIVALRDAAKRIGNYRLTGAELYVTIEPCQMCVGAMVHARIARVIYGTPEPRAGAIESAMRAHEHPSLNHRMEAVGRVMEAECREVIQRFFRERRATVD